MKEITLSRETAQTIYEIYVESDNLFDAAPTTITAVKELAASLGVEHNFYSAEVRPFVRRP